MQESMIKYRPIGWYLMAGWLLMLQQGLPIPRINGGATSVTACKRTVVLNKLKTKLEEWEWSLRKKAYTVNRVCVDFNLHSFLSSFSHYRSLLVLQRNPYPLPLVHVVPRHVTVWVRPRCLVVPTLVGVPLSLCLPGASVRCTLRCRQERACRHQWVLRRCPNVPVPSDLFVTDNLTYSCHKTMYENLKERICRRVQRCHIYYRLTSTMGETILSDLDQVA